MPVVDCVHVAAGIPAVTGVLIVPYCAVDAAFLGCTAASSHPRMAALKGPKHDQVEGEFFYIKQTRMVR